MGIRVGRYETLREIASGGMATVHLARALGAGGFERLFAVKMMHAHIAKDPDAVSMFLDEARLAARIRHPNVVATIDVLDEAESGLAIVMEYIEGPSLSMMFRALRKRERLLPVDVSLRILLDSLAGLDAAHELHGADDKPLNLVHRDVSPQNLIVGVDGITRITDFGVARAEARLQSTRSSQLKGKLAYMTPEQIAGMPVDRRCDVYASGVVLWEMLTGRRLFKADNEAQLVAIVAEGVKKSPREMHPGVPMSVDRACMRSLSRKPSERFDSAASFAEAIEEAASSVGLRIASHKTVAKFVKALNAHERPVGLPDAPESRPTMDSEPSFRRYPSNSDLTPVSSPGTASSVTRSTGAISAVDKVGTLPFDMGSGSGIEPSSGATDVVSVMSQPKSSRRGLRLGMGLAIPLAVVAGIVLAVALTPGDDDDAAVAASPDEAAEPAAPAGEVTPATTVAESDSAGEADEESAPDSSATPASEASADAVAEAPPAAPPVARPVPRRSAAPTSKKPPAAQPKTPKPSATAFETTDL